MHTPYMLFRLFCTYGELFDEEITGTSAWDMHMHTNIHIHIHIHIIDINIHIMSMNNHHGHQRAGDISSHRITCVMACHHEVVHMPQRRMPHVPSFSCGLGEVDDHWTCIRTIHDFCSMYIWYMTSTHRYDMPHTRTHMHMHMTYLVDSRYVVSTPYP